MSAKHPDQAQILITRPSDNLYYDDLKKRIKDETAPSGAQAHAIPGKAVATNAAALFETDVYKELEKERTRLQDFVNVTCLGVDRRLSALQRQTTSLISEAFSRGPSQATFLDLERLAKLENRIMSAGTELRDLERFLKANTEGFRKILKKYYKWTQSSGLEERFRRLSGPGHGYLSRDALDNSLTKYHEISTAIRAPFGVVGNAQSLLEHRAVGKGKGRDTSSGESRQSTAPSSRHGVTHSGFSTAQETTPATSAPELGSEYDHSSMYDTPGAMRPKQKRKLPKKRLDNSTSQPRSRYWNEYEDGSEAGDEDQEYLVATNDTGSFLGPAELYRGINSRMRKLWPWLETSEADSDLQERRPLLKNDAPRSEQYQSFGTIGEDIDHANLHPREQLRTDGLLTWSAMICSIISILLMISDGMLLFVARPQRGQKVESAVILCISANFVFAFSGLACMATRSAPTNWTARMAMLLLILTTVFLNAIYLYALNHPWAI